MAIIKDLNSSFGIVASYHRITSVSVNYKMKQVVICVSSYSTKETRANNYNPLEEIDIEVPTTDFNKFKDTNVINNAYLWLKPNVVGFEDSIDDLDIVEDFVVDNTEKEDNSSGYKITAKTNLYRYFSNECKSMEFNRKFIKIHLNSNNEDYDAKVMKELDKDHFFFLLKKTNKYKKMDINDISVYL